MRWILGGPEINGAILNRSPIHPAWNAPNLEMRKSLHNETLAL